MKCPLNPNNLKNSEKETNINPVPNTPKKPRNDASTLKEILEATLLKLVKAKITDET